MAPRSFWSGRRDRVGRADRGCAERRSSQRDVRSPGWIGRRADRHRSPGRPRECHRCASSGGSCRRDRSGSRANPPRAPRPQRRTHPARPRRPPSEWAPAGPGVSRAGGLGRAATDHAMRDRKRRPSGGKRAAERAATWLAPARAFVIRKARSRLLVETKGLYPAPLRALEAVATGLAKGMAAGLAAEAAAFGELAVSETGRNLTALAMLTLHQRKAALARLGSPRPIANLGAVGLGFM